MEPDHNIPTQESHHRQLHMDISVTPAAVMDDDVVYHKPTSLFSDVTNNPDEQQKKRSRRGLAADAAATTTTAAASQPPKGGGSSFSTLSTSSTINSIAPLWPGPGRTWLQYPPPPLPLQPQSQPQETTPLTLHFAPRPHTSASDGSITTITTTTTALPPQPSLPPPQRVRIGPSITPVATHLSQYPQYAYTPSISIPVPAQNTTVLSYMLPMRPPVVAPQLPLLPLQPQPQPHPQPQPLLASQSAPPQQPMPMPPPPPLRQDTTTTCTSRENPGGLTPLDGLLRIYQQVLDATAAPEPQVLQQRFMEAYGPVLASVDATVASVLFQQFVRTSQAQHAAALGEHVQRQLLEAVRQQQQQQQVSDRSAVKRDARPQSPHTQPQNSRSATPTMTTPTTETAIGTAATTTAAAAPTVATSVKAAAVTGSSAPSQPSRAKGTPRSKAPPALAQCNSLNHAKLTIGGLGDVPARVVAPLAYADAAMTTINFKGFPHLHHMRPPPPTTPNSATATTKGPHQQPAPQPHQTRRQRTVSPAPPRVLVEITPSNRESSEEGEELRGSRASDDTVAPVPAANHGDKARCHGSGSTDAASAVDEDQDPPRHASSKPSSVTVPAATAVATTVATITATAEENEAAEADECGAAEPPAPLAEMTTIEAMMEQLLSACLHTHSPYESAEYSQAIKMRFPNCPVGGVELFRFPEVIPQNSAPLGRDVTALKIGGLPFDLPFWSLQWFMRATAGVHIRSSPGPNYHGMRIVLARTEDVPRLIQHLDRRCWWAPIGVLFARTASGTRALHEYLLDFRKVRLSCPFPRHAMTVVRWVGTAIGHAPGQAREPTFTSYLLQSSTMATAPRVTVAGFDLPSPFTTTTRRRPVLLAEVYCDGPRQTILFPPRQGPRRQEARRRPQTSSAVQTHTPLAPPPPPAPAATVAARGYEGPNFDDDADSILADIDFLEEDTVVSVVGHCGSSSRNDSLSSPAACTQATSSVTTPLHFLWGPSPQNG